MSKFRFIRRAASGGRFRRAVGKGDAGAVPGTRVERDA